jgi:beta-glucosidase
VVASLLFGEVNPSGKLPITFPRRDQDVPANTPEQYPGVDGVARHTEGVFVGYRHYDARGIEPLFPFGHGLSYTTFRMSRLKAQPASDGRVTVTVRVTNNGRRAGAEVVQVYVGKPATDAVPQPPRQLGGFARVTLQPGETRQVTVRLPGRAFAHWDVVTHRWVIPDGVYQVYAGASSRDPRMLSTSVRLRGVTPSQAAAAW